MALPPSSPPDGFDSLTDREFEVLVGIANSLNVKEIAFEWHLSSKTVEYHRANLYRKTGCHCSADLTRLAWRHGLCDPEELTPESNGH